MPLRHSSENRWGIHFKGKRLATIEKTVAGEKRGRYTYRENAWVINICYLNSESPEFEKLEADEGLTDIIHKNICHCVGCLKKCIGNQAPGVSKKILGKEIKKICVFVGGISFKKPDTKTLNCVKNVWN